MHLSTSVNLVTCARECEHAQIMSLLNSDLTHTQSPVHMDCGSLLSFSILCSTQTPEKSEFVPGAGSSGMQLAVVKLRWEKKMKPSWDAGYQVVDSSPPGPLAPPRPLQFPRLPRGLHSALRGRGPGSCPSCTVHSLPRYELATIPTAKKAGA